MYKFVLLALLVLFFMPRAAKASENPLINLALGKTYQVVASWPDAFFADYETKYEDKNGRELTDGQFGTLRYQDAEWRCFYRQGGRTIIVDLGDVQTVNSIKGHFLQNRSAGIFVPRYIDYYLSTDNENFSYMGTVETAVGPWNNRLQKEEFVLEGLNHQARYVKIQFPIDVYVFMDELEVFGREGIASNSLELQSTTELDLEKRWEKSAVLGPEAIPAKGFMPKGTAQTGGAEDIVLAYYGYAGSGDGTWLSSDFMPYVAYLEDFTPKDWFFDTVLLLPGGETASRRKLYATEASHAATIDDWLWYLDETFKPDRQLNALNKAVDVCGNLLQDKEHKVKVILTLVDPSPLQNRFGALEPGGKNLNFNHEQVGVKEAFQNRLAAVEWLINQFLDRFAKADAQYLELIGFYWQPESISYHHSPYEDEFVRKVADLVHEKGLKLFWIPFYGSPGSYDWHNYGFDAAILQPNYVFSDSKEDRVKTAASIAYHLGMGVEMEKHWNDTLIERNKWRDYLNGGVKYGYMNGLVAYYQNIKDFGRAAATFDKRTLYYDYVYQFVKGEYEITE